MPDILRRYVPVGGKVLPLGGDFRRILPVVLGGNRSQTDRKCRKNHRWGI
jgi:PIF1-like helicase